MHLFKKFNIELPYDPAIPLLGIYPREYKIYVQLYDINHSKILFDPAPREMEIKTKINKWDPMKLKSFCGLPWWRSG